MIQALGMGSSAVAPPRPPHSAAPHLIRSWRHADALRTTSAVHNVQGLEFV